MNRRSFLQGITLVAGGVLLPAVQVHAKNYLTVDQAKLLLCGEQKFTPFNIDLTKQQGKSIAKASRVRVRNLKLHSWRTEAGGWLIIDQVIGKHENIDLAVALDADGKVSGLEILTYRETYGHQVRNPKWRAQFHGWKTDLDAEQKKKPTILKLDRDIKNIAGATLSCRHITDGINRLSHTWQQVLRHL